MAALTPPGDWTYGIQLPIQTLTRTLVDPWEDDATVADLVTIARTADTNGYGFVGVCDHIAIPDNDYAANMTTTWYDTVATLSYLAAHTETTRLLSVVLIAAYRHPLATAKAFGTLDHLSNGRAILGVGAGHVKAEFDALGVDFGTRGKRLDETIDAVRGPLPTPTSAMTATSSRTPTWVWPPDRPRPSCRSGSVAPAQRLGAARAHGPTATSRWACPRSSIPKRSSACGRRRSRPAGPTT